MLTNPSKNGLGAKKSASEEATSLGQSDGTQPRWHKLNELAASRRRLLNHAINSASKAGGRSRQSTRVGGKRDSDAKYDTLPILPFQPRIFRSLRGSLHSESAISMNILSRLSSREPSSGHPVCTQPFDVDAHHIVPGLIEVSPGQPSSQQRAHCTERYRRDRMSDRDFMFHAAL